MTGQVGIGKANASEPLLRHRNGRDDIRTDAHFRCREESGGCTLTGQVVSGVEAARARSAAGVRNVGRQMPIRLPWQVGVATGSASSGGNREALSTVAVSAGGSARSSGDAPVMGAERRGRLIWGTGSSGNHLRGLRLS